MAMRAAGGQDAALGGGPATIRQFLSAGLIDEIHLAIAPVLLGEGERLYDGPPAGWDCAATHPRRSITSSRATEPSLDGAGYSVSAGTAVYRRTHSMAWEHNAGAGWFFGCEAQPAAARASRSRLTLSGSGRAAYSCTESG